MRNMPVRRSKKSPLPSYIVEPPACVFLYAASVQFTRVRDDVELLLGCESCDTHTRARTRKITSRRELVLVAGRVYTRRVFMRAWLPCMSEGGGTRVYNSTGKGRGASR